MRSFRLAAPLLAALTLLAPAADSLAADRPTPSGLPVPRYISLKFDTVNARAGPGDDHKLLWVYRAKGLPVQVLAENSEWRRICDPDRGMAWVHRRVTDGRRTVMRVQGSALPLRRKPKGEAKVVAYLKPRALASLDRCEDGWCLVKVDGVKGWTPATAGFSRAARPAVRKV